MNLLPLFFVAACVSALDTYIVPPVTLDSAPYAGRFNNVSRFHADWAHKHWIWLSSSEANQDSLTQFVNDFLAWEIPVGAVNIDSLWSTGVNDFNFTAVKYPHPKEMITNWHNLGLKVICWATSMMDTDSPTYQEGKDKNYYLNDGKTIKWWHGHGSFIDYTNPDAMDWWHAQMDLALECGVDGFKCDGTVVAKGHKGVITEREYADAYYGDFLDYSRKVRGPEALIMARPVDTEWSFAPQRVMFSGWVGDNDPTFEGMEQAIMSFLHSAHRDYLNFGSDIGGYRHGPGDLGRTVDVFTRWFQMGAFCPLMENGGDNEHRPWKFDAPNSNKTVDTYRVFATIHHEMIPYLLSTGTQRYAEDKSAMLPVAEPWLQPFKPSSWDWKLGDSIYVAPMVDNSTERTIKFPKDWGNWVDWWDTSKVYHAGDEIKYKVPWERFPVFRQQGSILPLHVETPYGGHGDASFADALTFLVTRPADFSTPHVESCKVHEFQGPGRVATYHWDAESELTVQISAAPQPVVIVIRGVTTPTEVQVLQKDGSYAALRRLDTRQQVGVASQMGYGGWGMMQEGDDKFRHVVGGHEAMELVIRPGFWYYGVSLHVKGIHSQ